MEFSDDKEVVANREGALNDPKQTLAEKFLHFIEEAFGKRVYVFTAESSTFLKQLLLLGAQVSRRFHSDPHMLIALSKSAGAFVAK